MIRRKSIVSVLSVFRRTVGRIRKFFSLKLSLPQGDSSLLGSNDLDELAHKQTNKLTQRHPIALEDRYKNVRMSQRLFLLKDMITLCENAEKMQIRLHFCVT